MIVPVSNYVIACILFAALLAYAIYGLYWISVNVHRSIPEPPPPHGCTGSGYTGTVIIKDAQKHAATEHVHDDDDDTPPDVPPGIHPNQCITHVENFEPVPRRPLRRHAGKQFKKRKIPFAK